MVFFKKRVFNVASGNVRKKKTGITNLKGLPFDVSKRSQEL